MAAMLQGSTAEEIFLSYVSAFDKVSNKFKNLQQICNNWNKENFMRTFIICTL